MNVLLGKILEPEIVTVSESTKATKTIQETPKLETSKPVARGKGAGKKAQMLEQIATSKAVKESDNVEKIFSSWQTVRKNFDSERLLRSKYLKTKAYLRDLPQSKRIILQAEIELYLVLVLLDIYRGLCSRNKGEEKSGKEELFGTAALIWDHVRRILISSTGLTKTITDYVEQIVTLLQLPVADISQPVADRKLSFDPKFRFSDTKEFSVSQNPQDFQLLYSG